MVITNEWKSSIGLSLLSWYCKVLDVITCSFKEPILQVLMILILPSLTASLANQQGWYNWLWIFCLTRLSNIIWVERTNQLVGGMFDLDYGVWQQKQYKNNTKYHRTNANLWLDKKPKNNRLVLVGYFSLVISFQLEHTQMNTKVNKTFSE